MNLQQTAYNAMGIYKGAIVVMEVDTGKNSGHGIQA